MVENLSEIQTLLMPYKFITQYSDMMGSFPNHIKSPGNTNPGWIELKTILHCHLCQLWIVTQAKPERSARLSPDSCFPNTDMKNGRWPPPTKAMFCFGSCTTRVAVHQSYYNNYLKFSIIARLSASQQRTGCVCSDLRNPSSSASWLMTLCSRWLFLYFYLIPFIAGAKSE